MGEIHASAVDKWLTEEGGILLKGWARDGLTNEEIAIKMGINRTTLSKWVTKYEEIKEALREGKEVVDYRVENALLRRALGYKVREIKTIMSPKPDKDGNKVMRMETVEKEVPPDPTSIAIWLNNRKGDKWKRNRDNFTELSKEDRNITIKVITQGKDEMYVEQSNEKEQVKSDESEEIDWDSIDEELEKESW